MVGHEDICDMEVALRKLLMIVDQIEMVREVCVGALLLERIVPGIIQVVVLVVECLGATLLEGVVAVRVHQNGFILTRAVRVLKRWVTAEFTELTIVAIFARTGVSILVILAKVVAHEVIRVFFWLANRVTRGLPAPLANLLLHRFEAADALLACGTGVRRRADASTVFVKLGPPSF